MSKSSIEKSPHYWWYQYLKRHDGYRRCCQRGGAGKYSGVYQKFGDIHQESFDEWWAERRDRFIFSFRYDIERVTPTSPRAEHIIRDYAAEDDSLVLIVNLHEPKRSLQKAFNKLLQEHHPNRRGRPLWDDSKSDMPLCGRPNIAVLKRTLHVYDTSLLRPDLPLWRIGEICRLNPSQFTNGRTGPQFRDQHRVMTAIVSRYLRQARALIENAGHGIFPKNHR